MFTPPISINLLILTSSNQTVYRARSNNYNSLPYKYHQKCEGLTSHSRAPWLNWNYDLIYWCLLAPLMILCRFEDKQTVEIVTINNNGPDFLTSHARISNPRLSFINLFIVSGLVGYKIYFFKIYCLILNFILHFEIMMIWLLD